MLTNTPPPFAMGLQFKCINGYNTGNIFYNNCSVIDLFHSNTYEK